VSLATPRQWEQPPPPGDGPAAKFGNGGRRLVSFAIHGCRLSPLQKQVVHASQKVSIMKRLYIALSCSLLLWSTDSIAGEMQRCEGPQLGTWKLQSFTTEDLETGQKTEQFGPHPSGYLSYGADNRSSPAATVAIDAEKIELFDGFVAYAGVYSIEGDQVSHHIDISWNQAWTGTTQVRRFKIDGNSLYIRSMPGKSPLSGRQSSFTLVWTKVQ
jgi:hypothetical protein